MSFLFPLTLFSTVFFVFSLFFPPSSAAFYTAGALVAIAGLCLVFPLRMIIVVVKHAAIIAAASCVVAFGLLSLTLFTWYASVDHLQGGGPTDGHWFMGMLAILLPPVFVRFSSMARPLPFVYGAMFGYAVLIGGGVVLVEHFPILRSAVGVLAVAGLVIDRRFLTIMLLEERL